VLPLRLFRQPVFDIVSAALFMTTLALMVVIVFLPLFLQSELGMSATESGFLLLPVLLAGTLSTILSGRAISRTGRYKRYPLVGLGVMALGLVGLSTLDSATSTAAIIAILAFFGLGFGLVSQVLTTAIQNAVDRRDLGIATASANLFRSLGGAVGAGAFGAVYAGASVFLYAAPAALIGLLIVLALDEAPLGRMAVAR
jgi:predicted MFS family arabinose efflux permease